MYIVTIQNDNIRTEIHGENENVLSGKIAKGINTIDSFTMSLHPANAGFYRLHDFQTLVDVYNTQKKRYEFFGRVLYSSDGMSESGLITKDVTCESFFGFFCDSEQYYVVEKNWTVNGLLSHIVDVHNSQVEDYKKFKIGEVTVTDPNDNLYIGIQRKNTWETLKEKLIDTLGGEFRFRMVDGEIYLDYLKEIGETKETAIAVSRNMKSIIRERDPSEYVTRLIPLGAKLGENTEERLDITSVNGGKNYIDDEEAIEAYGIHVKSVEFDDVTEAYNLLAKGKSWLAENNKLKIKYTATALDLSLLGLDIDDFDVYNSYPLLNHLLKINDTARIIKKNIDVCDETKSTIEFGEKFETLFEIQKKQATVLSDLTALPVTVFGLQNDIIYLGTDLANKVGKDENDLVVKMINEANSVIIIEANRLIVDSDNFELTADGKVTSKYGVFDYCTINESCEVYGVLKSKHISACENGTAKGAIDFEAEDEDFVGYAMTLEDDFQDGVAQVGSYLHLGKVLDQHSVNLCAYNANYYTLLDICPTELYAESRQFIFDNSAYELGYGWLKGYWEYNGSEIATKADIQALEARIAAL